MEIVFASANRHKLFEAQKIFGPDFQILLPADLGFTGEIPETHETLAENSAQKAQFVWDRFGKPCFSDDTGLEVDALGGAPGVYSARYAGEPANTVRNIEKLLRELGDTPYPQRTARFRCVVSYIDAQGRLTQFEGRCEGHINFAPVRLDAFGYDPVFIPDGLDVTLAEIPVEVKNSLSHRGKAMDQLVWHLKQNRAQ
ncbi:MAG: RdgB/HAM1 family non-canonical purine NTP pyrophosphatase [Bacteroidales bacterium]|jgi:XTP/dITP diphosphohydrolase|nr:RdgB/HAM1 family non-canonical purine NTP pyrophosphatase [Bacteroidales bacterium]